MVRTRHVQVKAWMIQSKNHLPLDPRVEIPRKYKVPMIINFVDQAPFVEDLDSRMSLYQSGENDAKEQAQVQARVQGPFDSYFGHLHEVYYGLLDLFKGLKQRRNQEAQVREVSSCLEKVCKKLKLEGSELALWH